MVFFSDSCEGSDTAQLEQRLRSLGCELVTLRSKLPPSIHPTPPTTASTHTPMSPTHNTGGNLSSVNPSSPSSLNPLIGNGVPLSGSSAPTEEALKDPDAEGADLTDHHTSYQGRHHHILQQNGKQKIALGKEFKNSSYQRFLFPNEPRFTVGHKPLVILSVKLSIYVYSWIYSEGGRGWVTLMPKYSSFFI